MYLTPNDELVIACLIVGGKECQSLDLLEKISKELKRQRNKNSTQAEYIKVLEKEIERLKKCKNLP